MPWCPQSSASRQPRCMPWVAWAVQQIESTTGSTVHGVTVLPHHDLPGCKDNRHYIVSDEGGLRQRVSRSSSSQNGYRRMPLAVCFGVLNRSRYKCRCNNSKDCLCDVDLPNYDDDRMLVLGSSHQLPTQPFALTKRRRFL